MKQSNNSILKVSLILMLCLCLAGCASLQRKFVRKKKKEERISPVITTHDYSKGLRVEELYKKYFLFWKTWQSELIGRLDATYKKRIDCYDNLMESLAEMRKYLASPKAEELDPFIAEIRSKESVVRKRRITKSQKYKIKQMLERTMRQIEKKFSYEDVKELLELRTGDAD